MRDLFAALVDDAGLYPPEELAMAAALARYRHDRAAATTVLSGRFLCGANRLEELIGSLQPDDRVVLGLISPLDDDGVRAAVAEVTADHRLTLGAVEGVAAKGIDAATRTLSQLSVPGFVEVPLAGDWRGTLGALSAAGTSAKVRCGGVRAELFPSAEDLGAFVLECVRLGLGFKATAGLHHAVRHTDERTGFTHHGFLNLLLAVARAVQGGGSHTMTEVLASRDAAGLVAEARALPDQVVQQSRAVFVSYGSCSTSEPVADLVALGLVA